MDITRKQFAVLGLALGLAILPTGCVGVPKDVDPVQGFELNRYLGRWYEIARLDSFVRTGPEPRDCGLQHAGRWRVRVLNRGYSEKKKEWKTAEGKAYFVKESDRIFELDQRNYEYAIISGPSKSYLWILARTPELEPGLKQKLIFRAAALGFDTTKLILPEQKQPPS